MNYVVDTHWQGNWAES